MYAHESAGFCIRSLRDSPDPTRRVVVVGDPAGVACDQGVHGVGLDLGDFLDYELLPRVGLKEGDDGLDDCGVERRVVSTEGEEIRVVV